MLFPRISLAVRQFQSGILALSELRMGFCHAERNTGVRRCDREDCATAPSPTTDDDCRQYSFPKIGDETVRIEALLVVSIVGIRCNTSCNTAGELVSWGVGELGSGALALCVRREFLSNECDF